MAELLIAVTVTALLLSSVCGIYMSMAREWERQRGENDALVASATACSRLSAYISQAMAVSVVDRFSTGDTLAVNLPADAAYGDLYVPAWVGRKMQFRSGTWLVFYLSDSSGSFNHTGSILWAGTANMSSYPYTVNPDTSWSLYYGGPGRIAPLKSIKFTASTGSGCASVTVTAVSAYKIGQTENQLSISRTTCLRNYE